MSLLEQELQTLPEHPSSPPVVSGVRVAQSLVFCVVFWWSVFVFLFGTVGHAIVLSVLFDIRFLITPLLSTLIILCCLFFCDIRNLIAPLLSTLCSLFFCDIRILIAPLLSTLCSLFFCDIRILIAPLLSTFCSLFFCDIRNLIAPLLSTLCSLFFCDIRILIAPLISSNSDCTFEINLTQFMPFNLEWFC
jgi:hypothetical protein